MVLSWLRLEARQTVYLGGLITANGTAQPEVSRRIGEAKGIFRALQRCWSHANISRHRKLELYCAIVLPKLLYHIDSIWLLQADKRRLDGFHARCLRIILSVPCSYVSRISNNDVFEKARLSLLSVILAGKQAKLYNAIADMPHGSLLRDLTCEPGSREPRRWALKRRRGRPKQQWAECVHNAIVN